MKFSKNWLNKLINFKIDTEKLAEQLTMVGLEVVEIKPVAKKFHGVVVGEILEVNTHPNANKLTVCKVNIGKLDSLNIVCGAVNVRSKLKVAVATVGAELPNNFKIINAKIRGVDSAGMMCSDVELSLGETSSRLLELPNDAPIGTDLRKYLMLDDETIEIELTSDRGDCLSVLGVAREVAAINCIKRNKLVPPKIPIQKDLNFPIDIKAKEFCPYYCGRVIRGIDNQICTPIWMQEFLRRSGINSINPVVDIANYVMLEIGQPLHIFDLCKVDKKIEVRYAKQGETITLLSGNKVELNNKTLVIADSKKALAVAGIIGGFDSSVTKNTTDIFIESAFFVREKLTGIARNYGLQTDASYRYERGVDYELQLQALNRVTSLLLDIVGGKAGKVSEITSKTHLPQTIFISLNSEKIKKVLGVTIPRKIISNILTHLEMKFKTVASGWLVKVPSWRFDIEIEEDLIEDIARIYGYHKIPEQKVVAELMPPISTATINKNRICELMVDFGYHEVITYSFIDEKIHNLFEPKKTPLALVNPISPELALMRTSLWSGLIKAAKYNFSRQQQRIKFFEIGLCFIQQDKSLQQLPMLAGISIGDLYPEQWGIKQKEPADFFDLKNDVTSILKQFGCNDNVEFELSNTHSALHPKRSAQIRVANIPVGFVGEIHPKIKQEINITKQMCLFEINLNSIPSGAKIVFKEFSKFPKMQRDIAIIVDKNITWQQIKQKIVDFSKELLHNIELFDIYCDEGMGLNKKSMAIHLVFQSVVRTLVDTEVDVLVNEIISVLKQSFDAKLRG